MQERVKQMMEMHDVQGMTYAEIAHVFGISWQRVAVLCAQYSPGHFQAVLDKSIYPNIRAWMNENLVSMAEMLRRLDLSRHPGNYKRFKRAIQRGSNPNKCTIDQLIQVTGLTYEELFKEDE